MTGKVAPSVEISKPDHDEKEPYVSWEGTEGKTPYRLVVVPNTAGSPPLVVLEKMTTLDALGYQRWDKVELPKEFPQCILRSLAGEE